MTDPNLSFHSSVLNDTIKRVLPAFQQHRSMLDTMVADIRAVDKFLNDQGVKIVHSMECKGLNDATKDRNKVHELIWLSEGNSGYRLRVRIYPVEATSDKFGCTILSDTPLETRMAFYAYLPKFVESLAERLTKINPAPKGPTLSDLGKPAYSIRAATESQSSSEIPNKLGTRI